MNPKNVQIIGREVAKALAAYGDCVVNLDGDSLMVATPDGEVAVATIGKAPTADQGRQVARIGGRAA